MSRSGYLEAGAEASKIAQSYPSSQYQSEEGAELEEQKRRKREQLKKELERDFGYGGMDGLSTNIVDREPSPFNFKPPFEDGAPRNDSEVRTMSDRPVLAGRSKSSRSSRMIQGESRTDGTGTISAPQDSGPPSQGRSL